MPPDLTCPDCGSDTNRHKKGCARAAKSRAAGKVDVASAIRVLRIANRNLSDQPMVSLSIAVALTALGIPKEEVLREGQTADRARRKRAKA